MGGDNKVGSCIVSYSGETPGTRIVEDSPGFGMVKGTSASWLSSEIGDG